MSASLRPLAAAACAAAALVLAACDRPVLPAPAEAPAPKPAEAAKPAPAKPAERASDVAPLAALPEGPPSDAKITADATRALRAEPALAGTDLSVTTTHGVVSLTGTVRSPEQVAIAEARAQSPTGVMRVETHVSVAPG